jgi:hypothetical protein
LLLTFSLGIASVNFYGNLSATSDQVPIKLPQIESTSPIIMRLCPDMGTGKFYLENGNLYFNKEKGIDCTPGGGGSGGGALDPYAR